MTETSNTTQIDTTKRAAIVAGLRAMADDLETYDGPLPTHVPELGWLLFGDSEAEQKNIAAQIVTKIDGPWEKGKYQGGKFFDFTKAYPGGLRTSVVVDRAAVCERVVVGTKTVDHPPVEAQPARTETVEVVEWKCLPLLADGDAA